MGAVRIVCATRLSRGAFAASWLAGSLGALSATFDRVDAAITFDNARGLSEVYNEAIDAAADGDVLVFVHDDVRLRDADLAERVCQALTDFDVVGVAGNTQRVSGQVSWVYVPESQRGADVLSGAVVHPGVTDLYGDAPREVKLLDGLLLAARAGTLRHAKVRFDPQFKFHFYDLDFCRACEEAGLRMGTWPLDVAHGSTGAYGSAEWREARDLYLAKWKE